ncbi:hypothetical protein BU16DRAFT_579221 [Lophium mytilinum]|uniref:RRM domain-containing protein n=1 Tax=Lophium mytilinum TaxID=390894 RepID=A0A6A6R776_9PEZI|nr:hypothetical protein BU16DRAFT_579221 [Lophium mytilinum]
MFLPRVLLKKGMHPPAKRHAKPPTASPQAEEEVADPQAELSTRPAALQASDSTSPESTQQTGGQTPKHETSVVGGKRKLDQTSLAEETTTVPKKAKEEQQPRRGSNFTPKKSQDKTGDYLKEVALGVEIFFSDYAHRDSTSALNRLQKVIDGESGYIHFQTLIMSRLLDRMKPYATLDTIRRALQAYPPETVEIAPKGFYARRKPSTYPLPSILGEEAAAVKEKEEGINFWDSHTIYVEPSNPLMCVRPTTVAASLLKNGDLSPELLPIQAVHALRPGCALIVLSGPITSGSGEQWLAKGLPKDWIVMSKEDYHGRTQEYEDHVAPDRAARKEKEEKDKAAREEMIRRSKIPSAARILRNEIKESKRQQAARREARAQREEKYKSTVTIGTRSAEIAFPDRWTFVRLSNIPYKLPVKTILKVVKDISPRPIDAFIAHHSYGKLFAVLQFAMAEDAEAIVKAFNDMVTALKEAHDLENWLHRISSEHEPEAWKDIPDKRVFSNPSSTDRKKMSKRREKAKIEGTRARILSVKEAKAHWDQLQRKAGITCSGSPL